LMIVLYGLTLASLISGISIAFEFGYSYLLM
jgi:hypothetical protein